MGVERTRSETLAAWPARALAATLDRDPEPLTEGAELPAGWHWLYFQEPTRASSLGPDGHEARGDFLPAVPLPRRMWAGGRIRFHAPLLVGDRCERTSVVERVTPKQGRSGALGFVKVRHRIVGPRGLSVDEEQDIVYRTPPPAAAAEPRDSRGSDAPSAAQDASDPPADSKDGSGATRPEGAELLFRFRTDPVLLFRFSALTFNGHRIHYDHPYATGVEGYPGLVVHGPLLALLLLGAGVPADGAAGRDFEYRALAPLFCGEELEILADRDATSDGEVRLWASHPSRGPAMEARLR
jgi:3-methylfumaryl-CoA hydratase